MTTFIKRDDNKEKTRCCCRSYDCTRHNQYGELYYNNKLLAQGYFRKNPEHCYGNDEYLLHHDCEYNDNCCTMYDEHKSRVVYKGSHNNWGPYLGTAYVYENDMVIKIKGNFQSEHGWFLYGEYDKDGNKPLKEELHYVKGMDKYYKHDSYWFYNYDPIIKVDYDESEHGYNYGESFDNVKELLTAIEIFNMKTDYEIKSEK